MNARIVDEAISQAWLEAAKDLEIRVAAPFTVQVPEHEPITYEAHILDFGGPKGTVVGVLDDKMGDCRATQGYYYSNLATSYRHYVRPHFIDTLNDWGWFGPAELRPSLVHREILELSRFPSLKTCKRHLISSVIQSRTQVDTL